MKNTPLFATLLTTLLAAGSAQAGTELKIGGANKGVCEDDKPAVFDIKLKDAGFLSVAVHGGGYHTLYVADEDGQALPDPTRGSGDVKGDEWVMMQIPRGGDYFVMVDGCYEKHDLELAASWMSVKSAALEADPDGRPGTAVALQLSKKVADSIHPGSTDRWDWFSVKTEDAGDLTVLTKVAEDGDLALELYVAGEFLEPLDKSDKDMRDKKGNESVTIEAEAGSTYYFKVTGYGSEQIDYTISNGFIPA